MSDPFHDLEETITADVTRALTEDLRSGDLTASLIPLNARGAASVITREAATLCGTDWFERCFTELDPDSEVFWHADDGEKVLPGQQLCEISGNARALLSAERSALNFLQLMSAVATTTRQYVELVAGTKASIYDTRKTVPGLRVAQKFAVRAGGGRNHRMGLYDGILIKENHIVAAGGIGPALRAAQALVANATHAHTLLEIEVESLAQLEEALACGAKLVLLDNFNLAELAAACALNAGRAELEASGGVNRNSVRAIAETGVDRISVGELTKNIHALDLSMRFRLH